MVFRKIARSIIFVLLCLFSSIGSCQSRADDKMNNSGNTNIGKTDNDNKQYNQILDDVQRTVVIVANISNDEMKGDREFKIPNDTTELAIGGHPLTIRNIRGLEKLKNVKLLYLYAINEKQSDVINAIKVLKDSVEEIILVNCNINEMDFLHLFNKLTTIIFSNGELNNLPSFQFEENLKLEYFFWFNSVFNRIIDENTGLPKKVADMTEAEKLNVILRIDPSPAMKMIVIDTNYYPIIITEELLNKLQKTKRVAISKTSFDAGLNENILSTKYKNVLIYDNSMTAIKAEIPNDFQPDSLRVKKSYKVIGTVRAKN
jgi:hypothetical protein